MLLEFSFKNKQNMNHFESQQIYLFDQQVFVQKYII